MRWNGENVSDVADGRNLWLGRVTFQPCINKDLPYWAAMEEDWHLERSVFRRLLEDAARLMEKKEMQERLAHRPVDSRTGRELYKPLTGRKPQNVSFLSNL